MDDAPKYDPDRMTFEDLDLNDLDAMGEWLDHPNTIAYHDDIARSLKYESPDALREIYVNGRASFAKDLEMAKTALDNPDISVEVRERLELIAARSRSAIDQVDAKLSDLPNASDS